MKLVSQNKINQYISKKKRYPFKIGDYVIYKDCLDVVVVLEDTVNKAKKEPIKTVTLVNDEHGFSIQIIEYESQDEFNSDNVNSLRTAKRLFLEKDIMFICNILDELKKLTPEELKKLESLDIFKSFKMISNIENI